MKDFVIRSPYTAELEDHIQSEAKQKQELSEIHDRFYKPEGVPLEEFSPRDVIVRKRTFPDRETLVKIDIIQEPVGYTDTKEEVESLDGYEQWGEFASSAIEYTLRIEDTDFSVLIEHFSFGKYIKIEAPSEQMLDILIEELGLEGEEIIEKNSAELLAEDIGINV